MAGNNNTLVDEKLAVSLFLDSLLRDPELEVEYATPEIKPVLDLPAVEVMPEIKVEAPAPAATPRPITEPDIIIHEEVPVASKVEIPSETQTEVESIVPVWANAPFQVLLFEVAGLKLAVPLIELCGVIEWKDSVTEMPGHADFYMGILQHLDNKIAVIDTARMVLPAHKLEHLAGEDPRERVKHIVLIDDYKWGLACDKIGEVITLKPEEVRWRTSKSSRGWLAGTVIEHMCALLNSEAFAAMLVKGKDKQDT